MPENKDELLKKQNEEIQKLKKELKQASKPSSMFSVLKNTVKRNVHDFFIREDRMKNMDSKIKNLEKELAKKEEELNKTSAELFAAVNLGESDTTSDRSSENSEDNTESGPGSPTQDGPVFPQTAEDAVKEYFGPIDLAQLARYYYPEDSKSKTQEVLESPDEEPNAKKEGQSVQISVEPENMGNSIPDDAKPENQKQASTKKEAEKELPKTEPRPEPVLKETKKPEKTEKKEKDKQSSERKTVGNTKDTSEEKKPEPQTSLSVEKTEKNDAAPSGQLKTDTPKITKKSTSTQNKEEKDSKPTRLEKQPEVKQPKTDEQSSVSAALTTTATVVDKNGKKKSRKDRRKQKKNTQNPETQSAQPAAKTENNNTAANPGQKKPFSEPDFTESSEPDIDLPDDFGIVMEPEEPLPSDLPDINSGSGNIFDDLFNSDSDNWDDSNI